MKPRLKYYFCGFVLCIQSLFALPALAGAGYHNTPGASCGAFNNAQADRLQRDHVRIYLPIGAPATFVVCPMYRVTEDMAATAFAPNGFVNVFFDIGVPMGTTMTCAIRLFDWFTTHFPGRAGQQPREILTVTATKTAATGVSQVNDPFFVLTDAFVDSFSYYTLTCPLDAGIGINSIDFNQQ